ncbi:MAG: hypothetical protein WB661_01295 [Candidatus Bathyarchaeia archaeon]
MRRIPVVRRMFEVETIEAPTGGARVKRLITKKRDGAELLLGVCFMDPGEETKTWSSEYEYAKDAVVVQPMKIKGRSKGVHFGPWHEVYYTIKGELSLFWGSSEKNMKELRFSEGDAVYLAPGWKYRLKNRGTEPAFTVYAGTPPPE